MTVRYAIYFAPARDTPWWRFGAHWLGRDEGSGAALERAGQPLLAAGEFDRITAQPRRYGFHATLKAPFSLAAGIAEQTLLRRVGELARRTRAQPLSKLVPVLMEGFVALVPANPHPGLSALAQACVTDLDDLRAPLTAAEFARRRPEQLDARGRELLERFGYPLVAERFRFHMTLTGPVGTALAGQVVAQIARRIAQLNADVPPAVDRLCVFVEQSPGGDFRRIADEELQP